MSITPQSGSHPFDSAMPEVAEALLGTPNGQLSREGHLRYGTHGSLHIDLATGTFYDHETKSGGGVLDLISRETGRDQKGAVEWMREHGYLEPESRPLNGKSAPTLGKLVATYDYTDENDELIFQVVRYEPKTFRQRRRDETGAWSWSVKGVRQVPYRLPALIEAIANDRTVFIVEGEKDADNLAKWNIPATSNAGGAGKWHAEFAELFRGADVVVIPHNDQAGRDHATMVCASLLGVGRQIRCLALPGLPEKGDVSSWIMDGGTVETFHALVARAPEWSANAFVSKFGALRWEQIGTGDVAGLYPWLIEDIIPLNDISMAFGHTGTGKSFNMFDMAMCVARGIPFNGRNVEPGLVIYVAAEAGKGFAKRKIAYAVHHQLHPTDPIPFVLMTKRPNFFQDDADVMALIAEITTIAATYQVRLVLIVVDTMSAITQGMDEISGRDQSMVRKRLLMLQEHFGAAVVVVHHKPKDGNGPRGHGSQSADIETTIEFETLDERHRATVRKQREGKKGITWEFRLSVVEVGRNRWGNPETSCVVLPLRSDRKAEVTGFRATPTELLFMRALFDALVDHPSPPPAGLPPSITKVVEQRHVRVNMRERVIPAHEDSSIADGRFRTAFSRAGAKLRDGGVIGVQGNLLWPTGKPVHGLTVGPMP
jgi:hypothetical protein